MQYSFMAVFAIWIDSIWNIKIRLLRFSRLLGRHSAVRSSLVIWNVLRSHCILERISTLSGDNTNINPATIRSLGGLYYDANLTTFDADNAFIGCPLHRIHLTVSKALRHLGHIDDETTDSFVTMRQAMLSVIFEVEEEDPGQELANNEEDTGPAHIDSDIEEEKDVQEANDVIAMEMDIRERLELAGQEGVETLLKPLEKLVLVSGTIVRPQRREAFSTIAKLSLPPPIATLVSHYLLDQMDAIFLLSSSLSTHFT
ncbi:hypothetical protein BT69DRAFT_1349084 [Atractiella rhizophila]|nr:hypothetical protein BT69DRAFT_1349084 [Atractiella rhizophila]